MFSELIKFFRRASNDPEQRPKNTKKIKYQYDFIIVGKNFLNISRTTDCTHHARLTIGALSYGLSATTMQVIGTTQSIRVKGRATKTVLVCLYPGTTSSVFCLPKNTLFSVCLSLYTTKTLTVNHYMSVHGF